MTVTASYLSPTRRPGAPSAHAERGLRWRMAAAWGALFFNVMAFAALPTLVPIAPVVGQLLTQGSLALAVVLALVVNPRVVLRPNLFLVLLTIPAVVALMVSIHSEYLFGSSYRAVRLLGFVGVLWLLSPWWGRRDMLLLRAHRACLWLVLGMVLLGALVAPGIAFSFDGRLAGVLWPVPATQVAHYAAVLFGTSVVLWMCRAATGRQALFAVLVSGSALVTTHTRTALVAALVGILVAGASLFLGHVRVRRISALGAVTAVIATTFFASAVTAWLLRGQSPEEAGQLTGRTKVWSAVLETERPRIEELFGSGLSDQSFRGLPIDSNWVATLLDQGWLGVVVDVSILLLLLVMAAGRPRGVHRATALFLVVYCLVASFTETGLGTASTYTLELAVAASLLLPAADSRSLPRRAGQVPRLHVVGSTSPPKADAGAPSPVERPLDPPPQPAEQPDRPRVDVNTATSRELQRLPRVGRRTAAAIVRRRREKGPFKTLADLQDVPGVGKATLARLAPHIKLTDDT